MIGGNVDNGYNCRALELSERLEKESIMLGPAEFGNAFKTCMPNVMIWKNLIWCLMNFVVKIWDSWNWIRMPNVVK